MRVQGEYVLFGLKERENIIQEIINKLGAKHCSFDIRLILTEALTNAYKHGNKNCEELPIYLDYRLDGDRVIFNIMDSGKEKDFEFIKREPSLENPLEESGRGIYLIGCYCDEVNFINNTLIIEKSLIQL